jgi:Ca-activated chloride channel family protein
VLPTSFPTIDLATVRFGQPAYLWLLAAPAALLVLWTWRLVRRRRDVRRLMAQRMLPVRERYSYAGDLPFWLCALFAASLCIVALARPQARTSAVRKGSADIVVLQDASASMYVSDVRPDRWRRSIQFLRTFAESLSWQGDRVALALFAQLAAPQVRLTKDPNALFFFIDHLGEKSPFPLENAPTWDTNIEEGIRWGLRLVETDGRLFGKSSNPKAFLVISDGQAWSGQVSASLVAARERDIPVYVVGIGTTVGGLIPEPLGADGVRPPPMIHSALDRQSLVQLAVAGGGEYFEIGSEPDRVVAFRIIDRLRNRAGTVEEAETLEELYPLLLLAAAICAALGIAVLRKPIELLWQAVAAVAAALLLASLV